jgi:hypothetical protein
MGERSSSVGFPSLRPASGSWGYHSKSNVLTYPNEQKRSPRLIPLAYHSKKNDMSYNRTLSPGGRRLTNPARASDSNFDPYYSQRHSVYASPRASTDRVIPISSQTYLNPPSTTSASASTSRLAPGYDAYSGRPRRSSMLENTRNGSTNPAPPRNRPTVVQGDIRPSSPPRRDRPDYYIQPASSKEPKRQFEHKKVYSVDDGSAKLVADVDLGSSGERHHRRKESGGYRSTGHDRGRKLYHSSGKNGKTLDDDNAFSYTDPASMYKDTEPRWRETRPRRGSVDRGGASRERPVSMIEPYGDPRRSTREVGPPPSQRGWDKIQDLGRSRSTRDPVPHSPSRGGRDRDESRGRYTDSRDPYYIAPRKSSADRSRTQAVHQDRPTERYDSDYDDRREPRHHERRQSATRHNKDRSVSRRGFGVRAESTDRYGARGSDDSFETRNRDSGFGRDVTVDSQYPDRERKYTQEPKRKEHGRSYEDHDRDSDRDRPYRERHHRRRESERDDKKDSDNSFSGAAKIAAGGLGAAATLFGLNREKGKKEEREREEREEQERQRQREHERPREHEHRHEDRREREIVEPEKRRRGGGSNEDEPPVDRRDPYVDPDRGLGFAFEGGEGHNKPRDAPREPAAPGAPYDHPPPQPPRPQREPTSDRDSDRPYESKPAQAHASPPTNDADEDYRRRMEQVQRELGLPVQEPSSDSDPDRERRRREREARQAERHNRKMNGNHSEAPSHYDQAPPSGGLRASFEDDASQAPSQSTWSSAPTNNGQQDLRRRPSILDSSMDAGLMAQVIDNSQSEKRENRVRIVDPPSEEDDKKPKGILKKPTEKFPENPDAVREGVAPLKDVCNDVVWEQLVEILLTTHLTGA